ncbi:MAG: transcriptional activator NhaR [Sphingobacteriia bacterium]|nr:transcriptional activator NhaR [Sphingobacteriia bacterium]NCC38006.1 transcriptional activator NhaR [Gammaproteobacteria bacterium]
MPKLNMKHLRYFWAVATHGSIARASQELHLTPQTISGQLRELEEQMGTKLFGKSGRSLVLTESGQLVFSYADEIFRLTGELQDVISGHSPASGIAFKVGIAMVVPKQLAYRVLAPVLALPEPVRLVCHEAPLTDLLADLSVHKLDLVLADSPVNPALNIRAYNHVLGESGISFFATDTLAKLYRDGFPRSLEGAPVLMPTAASALHRALDLWFNRQGIRPRVVAEFEDRALMKTFGEAGVGIFTTPTALEVDILAKYDVALIARVDDVKERYYAISAERHIKHPAVSAITESARLDLFATRA